MTTITSHPDLKPARNLSPEPDEWPLAHRGDFRWQPRRAGAAFALTPHHEALGVFERYEAGGPAMRSHP